MDAKTVQVRLNIGGLHLHTSLRTVMDGARLGCDPLVKILQDCLHTERTQVPTDRVEHFIDADPTLFSYWLGYFRTGKVPYVERGLLRDRLICESEEAGLTGLSNALRELVDYGRAELRGLLERPGVVLHGARLQGQDLSMLGFSGCCLRRADLRDCILSQCDFEGASMEDAKLEGADMSDCNLAGANLSRADLRNAILTNAMLNDAKLPAWNSGLLEGVRLTGATGWMPANKDLSNAKLQGADLSSCDLSGVNLSSADLRGANLSNANMKSVNLTNAQLQGARLPAWNSGLLEGVKLAGAEGWVPADKDLSNAKLKGADLSGCDLSGLDMSNSDLQSADLRDANLQNSNLTNTKLQGAHIPPLGSGLMAGVKLMSDRPVSSTTAASQPPRIWKIHVHRIEWVTDSAGVTDKTDPNPYVRVIVGRDEYKTEVKSDAAGNVRFDEIVPFQQPQDQKLTLQVMERKTLSEGLVGQAVVDLTNPQVLTPNWPISLTNQGKASGRAFVTFFICDDVNVSSASNDAKVQLAPLQQAAASNKLHGADLREIPAEDTNSPATILSGAIFSSITKVAVTCHGSTSLSSDLKVGQPAVFCLGTALTASHGYGSLSLSTAPVSLRLRRVNLCNVGGDGSGEQYCAKEMELQTAPSVTGPWTSVFKFTSQKTKKKQTFAVAPDAPLLAGFAQVLVHNTHGGNGYDAYVSSMDLEGEAIDGVYER